MSAPATTPLQRLGAYLLAPASPAASPAAVERERPGVDARTGAAAITRATTVAVLGGSGSGGVAVSVGRALGRRAGAPCAVVGLWGAVPPRGMVLRLAGPRVLARARRLRDRGHDVVTGGGVIVVALESGDVAAEAARLAATVDVPFVLGVCGARDGALDARLADYDGVVLCAGAEAEPLVVQLAAERLRARLPGVPVIGVPTGPGAGRAAACALGGRGRLG